MAANFNFTGTFPDDAIPAVHTCEGENVSPPLSWNSPPEGAQSLALIEDDPDAPGKTFVHWVLFNLPPDTGALPHDFDAAEQLADRTPTPAEGANDFGDLGYGGPCPPPGDGPHGYVFRLYALDTVLDLGAGATKAQLTSAMDGHILAETDLRGTYER